MVDVQVSVGWVIVVAVIGWGHTYGPIVIDEGIHPDIVHICVIDSRIDGHIVEIGLEISHHSSIHSQVPIFEYIGDVHLLGLVVFGIIVGLQERVLRQVDKLGDARVIDVVHLNVQDVVLGRESWYG